jgi:hypothetical protein
MATLLALVLPVAVTLVAGAVVFGGRAARPMAIAGFILAVFAVCMVLVSAAS